jgi:hypothetical protein
MVVANVTWRESSVLTILPLSGWHKGTKKLLTEGQDKDDRDDRFLRLTALRTRHCTARLLQNEMLAARDVEISLQTVRNRLREDNIRARVPARAPQLTRQHRVARLAFAREHVNWDIGDWQNVMFSDESRFCLYANDRRMPVYRRPGERYLQCNFVPNVNYGGGSIMV